MSLKPTNIPLTVKEFEEELCGLCAGCGCSCGYILYTKDNSVIDLYGHPADKRGIGSLCTKGITYIQSTDTNPLRLRKAFFRKDQEYVEISYASAIDLAKEKLRGKKVAFLLDRSAGLEEYVLAKEITPFVFTDTVYLPFRSSTLLPQEWKDRKFILALDVEPVFSEVMSTRWIIDAVEKGAYLYVISSRYSTLNAKAKETYLMPPHQALLFLEKILQEDHTDNRIDFLKKSLHLIKESLVLVSASLMASPFKDRVIRFMRELRRRFKVEYAIVGDVMPFPSYSIKDLCESIDDFDALVVFGNPLRLLRDEHLEKLKGKFVLHFTLFPNFTSHHADLVLPMTNFTERDFINYRHGFGFLTYSPKVLDRQGYINPYDFLREVFGKDINLEEFLSHYGIDYQELKKSQEAKLKLPLLEEVHKEEKVEPLKDGIYLYTDNTLVEDLGHWHTWTHDMEKYQMAYLNERTAKKLKVEDKIFIRGYEFKVIITPNIADDVVFIPLSYEEYQPFHPGVSVGRFLKHPYYRFEVLQ
ncbi:MAG: dehydrogenase [Hydrogenobacter sp.]